MTEDRGLCWNAMMAVTVFADHPNNVLTIRVDWGHFILPPDWPKSHSAVFWLVNSSPWGHTWTRGTGHVTWCLVLPLTAARNATLYRDNFISSSIPWWHSPNIGNIANIVCFWHQGLKSIIHHCSAGSGFIGRSLAHWHQFLPAPLLSSAASKCSKLDQKPEIECG